MKAIKRTLAVLFLLSLVAAAPVSADETKARTADDTAVVSY